MSELYRRFEGYTELAELLRGSDEDVLVALGKPALVRIPGSDGGRPARFVSCLLHGNEDSGYRAVLDVLRSGERFAFDLWVFIGNVRAAHQEGWFAHRYLDDQEDFNRVWGLGEPTTRMRRCADAVLAELATAGLEAGLDLHNNTGVNPPYAIVPVSTPQTLALAAVCSQTVLLWGLRAHTLMETLHQWCPTVAVECGLPGLATSKAYALGALRRFLEADLGGDLARPPGSAAAAAPPLARVYELRHRVIVRPEVPFAFGGVLTDEVDFVLTPGLDSYNFGTLPAGTELGRVHPGGAMPLCATDVDGRDVTAECFALGEDGAVVVTGDVTPVMMTTTVQQARRDCLFYVARRSDAASGPRSAARAAW